MPIEEQLRKEMEKAMIEYIQSYKNWEFDPKRAKQVWRYEHRRDFWHGHIVGSLLAISSMVFRDVEKRTPQVDEIDDIFDLVQLHSSEIKGILNTWKIN